MTREELLWVDDFVNKMLKGFTESLGESGHVGLMGLVPNGKVSQLVCHQHASFNSACGVCVAAENTVKQALADHVKRMELPR